MSLEGMEELAGVVIRKTIIKFLLPNQASILKTESRYLLVEKLTQHEDFVCIHVYFSPFVSIFYSCNGKSIEAKGNVFRIHNFDQNFFFVAHIQSTGRRQRFIHNYNPYVISLVFPLSFPTHDFTKVSRLKFERNR